MRQPHKTQNFEKNTPQTFDHFCNKHAFTVVLSILTLIVVNHEYI